MNDSGRHYPLEETVDQALEDCDSPDSLRHAVAAELAHLRSNSERWEWWAEAMTTRFETIPDLVTRIYHKSDTRQKLEAAVDDAITTERVKGAGK